MAMQDEKVAMGMVDPGVSRLLLQARQAAGRGDHRTAHKLYTEATRLSPDSIEAWIGRSEQTSSFDEQLFCLSQVVAVDPENQVANNKLYLMIRNLLDQEPAIKYVDETDNLYRVQNRLYTSLNVPKSRFSNNNAPDVTSKPVRTSFNWMVVAFFGLALAGVGSLLIAPIAIFAALRALFSPIQRSDRVRAILALGLSVLIFIVSIPLAFLFYLHFSP